MDFRFEIIGFLIFNRCVYSSFIWCLGRKWVILKRFWGVWFLFEEVEFIK